MSFIEIGYLWAKIRRFECGQVTNQMWHFVLHPNHHAWFCPHWLCTEWKPRMMMGNQDICNSNFDFPRFTELLAGYRTSNCHKWGIILKLNPSPFRQQLNQYRIFKIQANGIQFSNFRGEEFWALTMLKSVTFDLWPNHIHSAVSLSRWNRLQWMTCRWKGKHFGFLIIWHLKHRIKYVSR